MKNLIFLCVASAVFILSVIVLNYAPTITGLVGKGTYLNNGNAQYYGWADSPCSYYSDKYNELEDEPESHWNKKENKQIHLDLLKEGKNNCLKKKAMIGLEYSAFNLDVIFGFICAILGILLYSGIKVGKIAGLIALGSGAIGFILTLVYVIYSGIIFNNDVIGKTYHRPSYQSTTNDINPYTDDPTLTSDGAFMEWKDSANSYVCIFYDKDNKDKLYQKYSDYGNKYLNYYYYSKKDESADYYKYKRCSSSSVDWETCKNYDEGTDRFPRQIIYNDKPEKIGECDKIYITSSSTDEKKNLYNSWVTTIVFGCFIFVLDAVLAVFGFLVYKDSSGTSGAI